MIIDVIYSFIRMGFNISRKLIPFYILIITICTFLYIEGYIIIYIYRMEMAMINNFNCIEYANNNYTWVGTLIFMGFILCVVYILYKIYTSKYFGDGRCSWIRNHNDD